MILKYWYSEGDKPLLFGADYNVDTIDVGGFLHTNDFYIKKLTHDLAERGRRFIKSERTKPAPKPYLI